MEQELARQMINDVQKHLSMMMSGASDQLKQMQSSPIGTEERSKRERTGIWKEIMSLDRDTSNAIMREMATNAGHKSETGLDDCDWCKLVKEQAGKK